MVPATLLLSDTMLTADWYVAFLTLRLNPSHLLFKSDAAQPAPEAGTWFQDYFVTLVKNANPAL